MNEWNTEIRKELADGSETKDAVEEEVVGDFTQERIAVVVELRSLQVVLADEDDLNEAFHHSTSFQLRQVWRVVTNVHTRTY